MPATLNQQVLSLGHKNIAGLLLLSVLSWSFTIGAPTMLHARPSRKGLPGHAGMQHSHPCCPRPQSTSTFMIPVQPEIPCGNRHDCCVRQAPANVPTLPTSCSHARQDNSGQGVANAQHPDSITTSWVWSEFETTLLSEYSRRSTVLRI